MDKSSKTAFRKEIKELRKAITNKEKLSLLIEMKIIDLPIYQESQVICLYKSMMDEVNMEYLINYSLRIGKKVLLPKIVDNKMLFLEINQNTVYEKSSFHILEPIIDNNIYCGDIDLVIVPGLAFDYQGHRLGYGKGFYDNFLRGCHCFKIGVGFNKQVFESIPFDELDVSMNLVIDEKKTYRI